MGVHMRPSRLLGQFSFRASRSDGFSYLWVLMTVAMMGVGLALAAEVYSTALRREQEAELLSIGRQFQRALASYYNVPGVGGIGEYPTSFDDILEDRRTVVPRRHLRKVFTDPVTGKAEWGAVRVGGRIVAIHSLSAAAAIKQDNFEPDQQSLKGKAMLSEWVF